MIVPPNGHTAFIGEPSKPVEWLSYLYGKMPGPGSPMLVYGNYYEGEQQKLAFAQPRYKTAFHDVFAQWRDNFCGMIIDSANERMNVDSFRLPDHEGSDKDVREFWQRNSMDAFSSSVHLDAMVAGTSYVLVWADAEGRPTITPYSGEQMVVQYKTGSLTEIQAAALFIQDAWGRQISTLWTEKYVYEVSAGTTDWENGTVQKNPLGVVPVVPFHNRARLGRPAVSDLHNVIPIQDAINKTVTDALTASETAAFPQRWVTGLEIVEDEHGNPVEPFSVAADKLLQAESDLVKFGSFEAADLKNYVTLVSMLVQHMASLSRLPLHYFLVNGGASPSGESLISAEAGLVAKVKERMLHFGESWERVVRLCFAVLGDSRRNAYTMETMWRDPEYRTEAQHVDALLKLAQLDVPREFLWSSAGFSAAQISAFRKMRVEDAKAAAEIQKLGPQPQTAGPAVTGDVKPKPPQGNSGNANRKIYEPSH
ncbi:Phage portal protein, SPP1 Gp6-like [Streptomyces sp. ScaeMP-e83]|nr:Phage portal protein, SPP1 Gp6-like [Streptomyces sp. ScaeMP-e83]